MIYSKKSLTQSIPLLLLFALAGVQLLQGFQLGLPHTTRPSASFGQAYDERCYAAFPTQTTRLFSTTTEQSEKDVDVDAIVKYGIAGITQMSGFALLLAAFDKGVEATGFDPPMWMNFFFFYACSLKSRVLNPLSNERPKAGNPVDNNITRPGWFPPGVIFPIMWILIIGPTRAFSSALVLESTDQYLNLATLSFLLHLTVGDVWNTVNNVEKRLGAAVSGVLFVILSAANASYQYYQVDEFAGQLLGATLLWLCTAGALVTSIWDLNPDAATGERDVLFPVKGESETRFAWFEKDSTA